MNLLIIFVGIISVIFVLSPLWLKYTDFTVSGQDENYPKPGMNPIYNDEEEEDDDWEECG